jgi:alpha-glucosidase
MKKILFSLFMFGFIPAQSATNDTLKIASPDGKVKVKIWMNERLSYSVWYREIPITGSSEIDLLPLNQKALSQQNRITSSKVSHRNSLLIVPVPDRRKVITDVYNELKITFKQPYQVTFKLYNEGIAYRISTFFKDSIFIQNFHFCILLPFISLWCTRNQMPTFFIRVLRNCIRCY